MVTILQCLGYEKLDSETIDRDYWRECEQFYVDQEKNNNKKKLFFSIVLINKVIFLFDMP